jgi:hypothetical protein
VTLSFRYDPELCDVVRASGANATSSFSMSVQPVVVQPTTATAGISSVTPAKPANVSNEVEMEAADPNADTLTIPNTPIDKL